MFEICGSCETPIIDTNCGCGIWLNKETAENEWQHIMIYRKALEAYCEHLKSNNILPEIITFDLPHENIQALFFKGTEQELEMLKAVLEKTRNIISSYQDKE